MNYFVGVCKCVHPKNISGLTAFVRSLISYFDWLSGTDPFEWAGLCKRKGPMNSSGGAGYHSRLVKCLPIASSGKGQRSSATVCSAPQIGQAAIN